ncbi:MAG: glycosyltransferase family 2 protein [Parcubacteria group bacterium]|nr:glycosyltransferase family 2 protein [Parcubacteria group bacterium]
MSISVIIPTYQHAKTLVRCVDSILSQTLKPDEIIVVDDGSTDDTEKVLTPYLDRIQYIKQDNQGAPVARNRGFDESTGEYVIFWDADVVGHTHKLETLQKALTEHSETSWAYPSFRWGRKVFKGKPFDTGALREANYIHTTSLIRREDFPGFDPSLKRFQDWDLWLTMSEQGARGVWVDEVLFDVLIEKNRDSYSQWLPSVTYKIPWPIFGWTPKAILNHKAARDVIANKHQL